MRSLAGISTRTLRRSTRRYVLTAIGASLGVAVLFAILVTSNASRDALAEAIDGQNGSADVVVFPAGAFDASLPAGTVERVRALPDVVSVVSTTGFRSAIAEPAEAGTPLDGDAVRERIVFVTGIDAGFETINEVALAAGHRPAPGADAVMVPDRLADDLDLALGDPVELATPEGRARLEVVGLLEDRGAATANQGSVLYTSRDTSRRLIGRPDAVTGLQVDLADGAAADPWIDANRDELSGVSVQNADDVAAGFADFITSVNGALTLVAAVAVFMGGFLVYLTFSVAVAERTRVLGTLRALGARRVRVQRVVVVEAMLLGAACSVVGLVVGYGLASVSVGVVGSLLDLELGAVGVPLGAALVSFLVGVAVSCAAAFVPARRGARTDPVSAMRSGALAIERTPRRWPGPVLLVAGVAIDLPAGDSVALHGLAMLTVLAGAVLSVQLALGPVSRLIGRATARLSRGTGEIAVRHLERERTRSSFTLALVMVALATIVSVAGSNLSMTVLLDDILDRQASAVQVGAPGAVGEDVEDELAAVPGADTISPVRFGQIELSTTGADGGEIRSNSLLQMIDPETYFEVSSLPYLEGDDETTRAALAAGGALVLQAHDANRLGVGAGDQVEVRTRNGLERFDVVGVYAVMGGGFGTVVGTTDLERLGAGRVNGFVVGSDGTDPEVLADEIARTVAADHQLIVDSPADTRDFAEAQLAGFFSIAYVILLVAVVISMLGLANTLVVTVLDRTREIGVLRSTGARRRQIRSMVTAEAITMALVAFVLALPLGAALTWGIINVQSESLAAGIDYQFPWRLLGPLAVLTLLVAALASALPARRAARLEIVDALRYE